MARGSSAYCEKTRVNITLSPVEEPHHILGLPQLVRLAGSLRLEQVAVGSGLLQEGGVDGVALLKVFLRRSVLADEAGDPRLRAGFLARLAEAVEDVGGGKAANGDVEAALSVGCHELATNCVGLKVVGSLSSSRLTSGRGMSLRRGLRSPAQRERSGSRNGEGAAARRAAVPKQRIVWRRTWRGGTIGGNAVVMTLRAEMIG